MATRKTAKDTNPKRGAKAAPEETKAKNSKAVKADVPEKKAKGPRIDIAGLYSDTLDVIEQRQGVDTSSLDVAPPMSTGLLQVDMILGGGVRSCMLTGAGNEQCAKTTLALTAMANAIKEDIPLIAFVDYEGCVTADTFISVRGQPIRISDLFNLTPEKINRMKVGFQDAYSYVDTVDGLHSYGGTSLRQAQLYYKGKKQITVVETSTGNTLRGHGHKMWVWDRTLRRFAEVTMETLKVGELMLVKREANHESWKPMNYNAFTRNKYEVSSKGRVRVCFWHSGTNLISPTPSNPKPESHEIYFGVHDNVVHSEGTSGAYVSFIPGPNQPPMNLPLGNVVYAAFSSGKYRGTPAYHIDGDYTNYRVGNLTTRVNLSKYRNLQTRITSVERKALQKQEVNAVLKTHTPFTLTKASVKALLAGSHIQSHLAHSVVPLDDEQLEDLLVHYEFAVVTGVHTSPAKEPVFDVSLSGVVGDMLPRSIITNGIVTHNSTKNSKPYVQSILKGSGINLTVDQVFGKKDKETGKWVTPPRVRYRAETVLERFYDWLSQILRELPDKRYVAGKWWLVFDEKNKKHVAKVGEFADRTMSKRYGNGLWVEAPNDKMQGIIFLDSYTAMNPEAKDEEHISNQLSVKASAFSKQLERVKGRMADKMVTIWGLNHLRSNPMAMFGPKEDEKGGNALKQFSDVRLRQTSRSLSGPKAYFSPKPGKKGGKPTFNEIEKSVEFPGGKDEYRYVHVKAIKNKLWTPNREGWLRIWVEDGSGSARGIDPVFDVMAYLKDTGQVKGNRSSLKLNLEGLGAAKKPLTWEECKLWILGKKEDMAKTSEKCGYKPMSLRYYCFKQIKSGVGEDLFNKMRAASDQRGGGDDDGDED